VVLAARSRIRISSGWCSHVSRPAPRHHHRLSGSGIRRKPPSGWASISCTRPIGVTCSTTRGATKRFAIRFYDEAGSAEAILEAARARPIDGVLAVGDRPTVTRRPGDRRSRAAGPFDRGGDDLQKQTADTRAFEAAGLPVPWFQSVPISIAPSDLEGPRGLSLRFEAPHAVREPGCECAPPITRSSWPRSTGCARSCSRPTSEGIAPRRTETALVEEFIAGQEFAVEGLMEHGVLRVLAIFDKPDPLDGPFFEETIYVTPSRAADSVQRDIVDASGTPRPRSGCTTGRCTPSAGSTVVVCVRAGSRGPADRRPVRARPAV